MGNCGLCLVLSLFLCGAPGFAQLEAPAVGPRVTFAQPIHDFGKVKSGDTVKHTYTFTNTGDQLLEITNVQISCGCTAANEWTRRVEPGQAGSVPIQFNTAGFGGEVLKTATVYSTDKAQPALVLQLKGTIWKPIDVLPTFAVLNIMPDASSASTTVKITISDPSFPLADVDLNFKEVIPGRAYTITLAFPAGFEIPGGDPLVLKLKTSLPELPAVKVPIIHLPKPVTVPVSAAGSAPGSN